MTDETLKSEGERVAYLEATRVTGQTLDEFVATQISALVTATVQQTEAYRASVEAMREMTAQLALVSERLWRMDYYLQRIWGAEERREIHIRRVQRGDRRGYPLSQMDDTDEYEAYIRDVERDLIRQHRIAAGVAAQMGIPEPPFPRLSTNGEHHAND